MLLVAVVGPTATGKSALGVSLAHALGGEVVNADAMQLYRGMDIGTAKLTGADRQGVPHHLLDVLNVSQEASVAAYQRAVDTVLDDVLARGRVPVLVGGSGLYVRAALDQLHIPPTDPTVRRRLEAEADEQGADVMHARLASADPRSAARILASNVRRVVRALEVVELTGRPFSATLPQPAYRRPDLTTVQIGLRAPRAELDARIDRRTRSMWTAGLLDEVRRLVPLGLRDGRTAARAVGYQQALQHLDGHLDEEPAQQQTAQATRRMVRRQESWFGRDERIRWLPYDATDLTDLVLAEVRRAR